MRRPVRRENGTMLVWALIILVVGAVVMAGWLHVMATRVLYSEASIEAVKRRIVLENSRAMASEYVLESVLTGSLTTSLTGTVAGGWGSYTFTATNVVPLTTVGLQSTYNALSPGGVGGYVEVISATLSDGVSDVPWNFNARSRSPMLAFDLFTSQVPLTGVDIHDTANLAVGGNLVLWAPDSPNTYSLSASSYQTSAMSMTTIASTGTGGSLLASNFAFPPVTTGASYAGLSSTISVTGSSARYYASLLYKAGGPSTRSPADPDATSVYSGTTAMVNTATSSTANGVTSSGGGTITIDLSNSSLQKVYITSSIQRLTLQGYVTDASGINLPADQLPAVLITYVETGSSRLNAIDFQNRNNRRLYLAIKKENNGTVTITPTGTLSWRVAGTFENTPITIASPGALTITGGFRTDQTVTVSSGSVSIVRETGNSALLERYGDRNVWLETFRND